MAKDPTPEAPAPQDILDKLLRAADTRADKLLQKAGGDDFGYADSLALMGLLGAVARVADLDVKWLEKYDPAELQQWLHERHEVTQPPPTRKNGTSNGQH